MNKRKKILLIITICLVIIIVFLNVRQAIYRNEIKDLIEYADKVVSHEIEVTESDGIWWNYAYRLEEGEDVVFSYDLRFDYIRIHGDDGSVVVFVKKTYKDKEGNIIRSHKFVARWIIHKENGEWIIIKTILPPP